MTSPAEALLAEWYSWLKGAGFRAYSTADSHRRNVAAFLKAQNVTDFAAVTVRDLDAYVAELQIEGKMPGTIASRISALRGLYDYATKRGLLEKDPAALVRLPPSERAERDVLILSPAEVYALEDAAGNQAPPVRGERRCRNGKVLLEPEKFFERRVASTIGQAVRDRAYIAVSYAGCLRVSEAADLTVRDILPPDRRDGSLALVLPRSKRRKRISKPIYIGARASRFLKEWLAIRSTLAWARKDERVFGLTTKGLSEVFSRVARSAGLARKLGRKTSPHILRASRASHSAASGLSTLEVAEIILRHRSGYGPGLGSVDRYVRAHDETRRRALALGSLPEAPAGLLKRELRPARIDGTAPRRRRGSSKPTTFEKTDSSMAEKPRP